MSWSGGAPGINGLLRLFRVSAKIAQQPVMRGGTPELFGDVQVCRGAFSVGL